MNILHLLPSLFLHGGTPRKIKDMIKYSKHKQYIYCSNCWEGYETYNKCKLEFLKDNIIIYEGLYGKNIYKHTRYLLEIIKKENIQVLHVHFNFDALLGVIIKYFNPSIKLVVSFVGNTVVYPPSFPLKQLLKLIYRKVDFFIYISNHVKVRSQNTFKILKQKKGQIVYNGVVMRPFDFKEHISNNQTIILTVGNLNPYKNIPILIDAMNIIINNYKRHVILNIAGDGPLRNICEQKINKYGIEKFVNLLGFRGEVGNLLNNCTLYVHPADNEGFGISVIEAMLMEKPVILSNAGALPELIIENESGLLANPYDPKDWANKIIKLLDDSKLRQTIAINGNKRANTLFNIKRFAEDHDRVYENI